MIGILVKVATMVLGGGIVSWLTKNLMLLGISAALLLVTNLVSAGVWYFKGHAAAQAKCEVNTLNRRIDELTRDKNIAKSIADETTAALDTLKQREADREQRAKDDAANVKPIEGCVIDPRPNPARRGLRKRAQ